MKVESVSDTLRHCRCIQGWIMDPARRFRGKLNTRALSAHNESPGCLQCDITTRATQTPQRLQYEGPRAPCCLKHKLTTRAPGPLSIYSVRVLGPSALYNSLISRLTQVFKSKLSLTLELLNSKTVSIAK